MLRWLPDGLTLLSSAITDYACHVLQEAGALDRLLVVAMVHSERRILAEGPESWIYSAAANRPPRLPWDDLPGGRVFVPPLTPRAASLGKDALVTLLTRRGGPLQSCDMRRVRRVLESPARTARLGYLCSLRAARLEGLSGPTTDEPKRPQMSSLEDYHRWRESINQEVRGKSEHVDPDDRPYESSRFSKSLTLVALGSLGMQLQYRCEKCFKLSPPELQRCPDHSQSDQASVDGGRTVNQRRSAARAADRVVRMVADVGTTRDLETARRARASQLFGAIFDRPIGDVDDWRAKVRDALQAAPTVQSVLPSDFGTLATRSALRALRRGLDPLEYDPWAWPNKIRRADAWIKHHKLAAPGGPPSGPRSKTLDRMDEVRRLRKQGLDDETIAKELKVSVRAMRVMFKRHES